MSCRMYLDTTVIKGVDKEGLGGLQPPHFFETIVLAIVRKY